MGIEKNGIPSQGQIESTLPPPERRAKGPYAVIECWQEIPCDPCVASCKLGAIAPMQNINDLPELDFDKCTGCGNCIAFCPGVAIFVIDETYGAPDEALIRIPHEFAPLPKIGDKVKALARDGKFICDATIVKIQKSKSATTVLHIVIPKKYIKEIRAIEPLEMK
jgi:Fe-S-cluster-containing hydrogenase component 2